MTQSPSNIMVAQGTLVTIYLLRSQVNIYTIEIVKTL